MSRIGKKPIALPKGVTVKIEGNTVLVQGPKGKLDTVIPRGIKVEQQDGHVVALRENDAQAALHGLTRALVNNAVEGVTKGYQHTLEIHGVGFKAAMKGKEGLQLQIGFSHDVVHKIPPGVEVKVAGAKQELLEISGIDKQKVGQLAAEIRASRPPEPYQGKGIRYRGEYILRKEGKKK